MSSGPLEFVMGAASETTSRKHILNITDKKLIVLLAFTIISLVLLASSIYGILAKQSMTDVSGSITSASGRTLTLDSLTKTNSEGYASIAITYKGSSNKGMAFAVTMDTMNMDAPPLAEYDLKELSYISGNGIEAKPLSWNVQETGHMGHHLRGILVFPLKENNLLIIGDKTKSFEIVIKDVAGIKQRVISWKII